MNAQDRAHHHVDVAVIGLGSAGEAVASQLAEDGLRVVGFEPNLVGGECPFTACMPSKALLSRAHARRRSTNESDAVTEWASALEHRDAVVNGLDDVEHAESLQASGVKLIRRRARIVGPHLVQSENEIWHADHIVIGTGSAPVMPPIDGLDHIEEVWTAEDALTSSALPASLAIVGGGAVGCELADVYTSFGAEVTVLERSDRLLPDHDRAVAAHHLDALRRHGIDVRLHTEATSIEYTDEQTFRLTLTADDGDERVITVERVLIAAGQAPRLEDVGLDTIGLEPGTIPELDDHRRSVEHPWLHVIGDANGSSPWTHGANRDAAILACSVKGGDFGRLAAPMPHCIFTDPPAAHVGQSADDVEQGGGRPLRGEGRASDIARFSTDELDDGLVVVVVDADTGTIVGGSTSGPLADELIATATSWVHQGTHIDVARTQVFPFPTISQVWEVAIADAASKWDDVQP